MSDKHRKRGDPTPLQGSATLVVVGIRANATAYGRAAVDLLARQVTELKAGHPLAPITVLVPSNYAAVATRRAPAARPGGIAAVDFLTLPRLAERLARDTRRPVSPPVLAQAVRAVLHDDPGVFVPVAHHPATELALVTATRELSGLTDAALDALANCDSRRAADVVRIARRDRLLAIAEDQFKPYEARGATGRAMFWKRDRNRIRTDLERFIAEDQGAPLRTEMWFDDVHYPLADGRSVLMRGSMDRVDEADDGSLVVIDYKTGSRRGYEGLCAEDPHQRGHHLQLAMYGVAAAEKLGVPRVHAVYWFTSAKGEWKREGYEIDDAVRAGVGEAITAIVDGIRGGLFPMVPSAGDL